MAIYKDMSVVFTFIAKKKGSRPANLFNKKCCDTINHYLSSQGRKLKKKNFPHTTKCDINHEIADRVLL